MRNRCTNRNLSCKPSNASSRCKGLKVYFGVVFGCKGWLRLLHSYLLAVLGAESLLHWRFACFLCACFLLCFLTV